MGLLSSLKGKLDIGVDDTTKSTKASSSSHSGWSASEEKRRLFGTNSSDKNEGQPSSSRLNQAEDGYGRLPGPPPSHRPADSDFQPPPGPPPPSHRSVNDDFQPPPGPPPNQLDNPPPYHDWTVIPDTSLLPPPPALTEDFSPTNNASYDSAEQAHTWCARTPVFTPSVPSPTIHTDSRAGRIGLGPPPQQLWSGSSIRPLSLQSYMVKTNRKQQDAILLSTLPIYFAASDNPLSTQHEKTIYFEIRILNIANENSGIAIGYAAKPYPPWRLPGWHRASLGVHGDDGRRFMNDSGGGRDFVPAFKVGETVGIGLNFFTQEIRSSGQEGRVKTSAFISRGGRRNPGDVWEIDEERDADADPVEGLMGEGDLYPAIGVFGGVEFEVNFGPETWLWKPRD